MIKIYLAASMFSAFDRERNEYIENEIGKRGNYQVFLPQRVSPVVINGIETKENIFEACRDKILDSNIVVALVDGADVDSGVCWELGYAYAKGIPAICVRTDLRKAEEKGVNVMIEYGSSKVLYLTKYHQNISAIIESIIREVEDIVNG